MKLFTLVASALLAASLANCGGALNGGAGGAGGGFESTGRGGGTLPPMGAGPGGYPQCASSIGAAGGASGPTGPLTPAYAVGCTAWVPPDAPAGGYSPPPPPGDTLDNGKPSCTKDACALVSSPDNTAGGFTGDDLLGQFNFPGTAVLTWYDGAITKLHFQATYDANHVSITAFGPGPMACDTPERPICRFATTQGVTILLSTDDGRLVNETFPSSLDAWGSGGPPKTAYARASRNIAGLNGSFQSPIPITEGAPDQYLGLLVTPAAATCNAQCPVVPGADDLAWADPDTNCAYDGRLVWTTLEAGNTYPDCPRATTVATWKWSR